MFSTCKPLLRPVAAAAALATATAVALLNVGLGTSASAAPDTGTATTVAQVSSTPAQTIQNIGASGAWWVNDLTHFSTATQQRVAELLFSSNGIQLSAYRYNIGGGGVGVRAGERAPQSLLVSPGRYDWNRDPGGTAFLRYASRYGVPDIVGFVNSAPAVWTTSGKSCGGSLKSDSVQAYATYLADIVTHFDSEGVKINYVSPMNEPAVSFSACNQEGMRVDPGQRDDIVRAVGRTLASRAPSTRISADESDHVSRFLSQVPQWIGQPGTSQYVANLAHHTYDFPNDSTLAQIPSMAKRYGKPTWASEICCMTSINATGYGAQYDPTITGALSMANIMYRDFAVSGDSAFHWWTALSKVMGCSPGSSSSCATTINSKGYNDGLIYYDPDYAHDGNQNLYITKRFYALGQYSKFVRPGSVRYPVSGAPSGVQIMATSLGGTWTLVVNNLNDSAQAVNVRLPVGSVSASSAYRTSAGENLSAIGVPPVSAGTASLNLPARSITTYVFNANGAAHTTASASATTLSSGPAAVPGQLSGRRAAAVGLPE
ncbi:glycoside hydrolase [Streptomyces sp. Li-HN-5-11]|uniref:glycoside hydrolase n=1 Tax=Streptomyces sp. Li-HN-5-11 TaxID=3075432 RepID=UPI0028ACEDBE|nr:glycoside hydrolase [Streptomyces sp. Li-HN-5-11]WNM31922.1 glycoside hydrolase [Streptomyces sp. Li-HN-5-11]